MQITVTTYKDLLRYLRSLVKVVVGPSGHAEHRCSHIFLQINVTISKGVLRFLGSVVGAVVGFLAMLNTATATNPYVLSIVLFVFAWLCGLLNYTKWKYAAFLVGGCCTAIPLHVPSTVLGPGFLCFQPALQVLNISAVPITPGQPVFRGLCHHLNSPWSLQALYTDAVLILAQYSPEAGAHGRAQYLGARMADISMAIAACMVLSLLQPWWGSTACAHCGLAYDRHGSRICRGQRCA